MQARPLGSVATIWPGTMRRQPLLPKVSWCTRFSVLRSCSTALELSCAPECRQHSWE